MGLAQTCRNGSEKAKGEREDRGVAGALIRLELSDGGGTRQGVGGGVRAKYSSRLTPFHATVIRYTPEEDAEEVEEVEGAAGKNKAEVFVLMPKLALARYPRIICFSAYAKKTNSVHEAPTIRPMYNRTLFIYRRSQCVAVHGYKDTRYRFNSVFCVLTGSDARTRSCHEFAHVSVTINAAWKTNATRLFA